MVHLQEVPQLLHSAQENENPSRVLVQAPPKRIFGFKHMSDQFVQNRCDSLNLYIFQVLHSSVWQCQEVADFLSESSQTYGIESREEENVLQRMTTDISDVSKSVG